MSRTGWRERWERWRDAFHAVNRAPGDDWHDRVAHHGYRFLLILAVAALLPFVFPQGTVPEFGDLQEGEVADRDIIARMPFTVYKSEEQLASERAEAEQTVAPIFTFDSTATDTAVARVGGLFTRLDSAVAETEGEGTDTAAVRRVLEEAGVPYAPAQVAYLAEAGRRRTLRRTLERDFRSELPNGVVPTADLEEVSSRRVRIRNGQDRVVLRDSVRTLGAFLSDAAGRVPETLSTPGRQLYQTLLVRFAEPTLRLDREATRAERERVRAAVEAAAGYVLEGERIVAAHERIGQTEMDKLTAYRIRLEEEGIVGGVSGLRRGLGSTLLGLGLLGILGAVLYFFRPSIYREVRGFTLVLVLVAAVLALAGIIGNTGSPPALVPVAFSALLISALFDGVLALVAVAVVAGILAGQAPFSGVTVPLVTLVAGAVAALAMPEIRRRSQSWILIALITGGYVVAGLALYLMEVVPLGDFLETVAWGGVNATVCTALAVGAALPALEKLTGRTTDQTLLELADLNQSLLRRLSREAPGTYAHSVSVANLAEAACVAIGANALLARVGVYYHDIGKMTRPQYFIENQPQGMNPHDRLPPARSAEVIREHVREGLRLADEAGLPRVIKDFIREHHGTQKISYFLAKARADEGDLEVDPGEFCYPGPKPQSRETAVAMLADAVESAARTLNQPTPERIRALIDRLVEDRVEDGQLDQCPLTFRDLDRVRNEFARVLTGLYHHRIDYPEAREEPPATVSPATPVPAEAPVPAETGGAGGEPGRTRSTSFSEEGVGEETVGVSRPVVEGRRVPQPPRQSREEERSSPR